MYRAEDYPAMEDTSFRVENSCSELINKPSVKLVISILVINKTWPPFTLIVPFPFNHT